MSDQGLHGLVSPGAPRLRRAAITAGMSAGAVAASGLSAFMIPLLGWRITLDLFALVGVVWAVLFWITFRDRPDQHPWVNAAEIALIRQPATRRTAENCGRRSNGFNRRRQSARRIRRDGSTVSAFMEVGRLSCSTLRRFAERSVTPFSFRGSHRTSSVRMAFGSPMRV